ncbi:duplicated ATPase component YkoD of energizing module of thiamin-regulated ECF transporter for hydroxymethylpyrimidine [Lentilactobacillus kosonis]|uniref:Duplicated ATPase component YkoD of energizing module of thiamin-regulated ECF transporter for hydroxymethylpyrimidine n=1 Tax=Lentilactobacillus kosonis TaxID=2810561 RepID=A0A401FM64_9LACO|nr:duplicated ATPase component YkoD of energizing module of thiamin-regulated ECF transporter for hydroxymethylpyrimidine [Lentilactobacillus kosonis]
MITFRNKNIRKIRPLAYAKQVSLLFQDAENQFLAITVQEEIELSKQHRITENYSDQLIDKLIDSLGFTERMDQVVYSLSEGQKKKLQILEMLIMDPPVLLLDEPFKGLDYESMQIVIGYLINAKQQFGQTQILISHQFTGLADLIDYHVTFANHNLQYQEVIR